MIKSLFECRGWIAATPEYNGESANVVALSLARKHGLHVSFMQFFVVGFPLMLLSVAISGIFLWVKFL